MQNQKNLRQQNQVLKQATTSNSTDPQEGSTMFKSKQFLVVLLILAAVWVVPGFSAEQPIQLQLFDAAGRQVLDVTRADQSLESLATQSRLANGVYLYVATVPVNGQPQRRFGKVAVLQGKAVLLSARDKYPVPAFHGPGQVAVSSLKCNGVVATIVGTNGSDTIIGTPGKDVILGLGGNDFIDGQGGDDIICGGNGNDDIRGGPGRDFLVGDDGNDTIDGGDGNDELYGMKGMDQLFGRLGNDRIWGGLGADLLVVGGPGDDSLSGGSGNDILYGEEGHDTLNGGSGIDALYGGWGIDSCLNGPVHIDCE